MTYLFWRLITIMTRHNRTRPISVWYCKHRFGSDFVGFYDGIPVVRTNHLDGV